MAQGFCYVTLISNSLPVTPIVATSEDGKLWILYSISTSSFLNMYDVITVL